MIREVTNVSPLANDIQKQVKCFLYLKISLFVVLKDFDFNS